MKNFLKILGILLSLLGAYAILKQIDSHARYHNDPNVETPYSQEKPLSDDGISDDGISSIGDTPGISHINLSTPLSAMLRSIHECPEHASKVPIIVLVIDDLGHSTQISEQIASLPGPLTLSFLPFLDNLPSQTDLALRRGHEVFLHLPMQPRSGTSSAQSEYVLKPDAPPLEIQALVDRHLQRMQGYQGINNHMGSAFTADPASMLIVLNAIKKRDLTWLDSVTAIDTVGPHIARHLSIPWLKRDVFLDHDPNPKAIDQQIQRAETIARQRGLAVVIAHPKKATVNALQSWLPRLKKNGFAFAGASQAARLLDRCGVYASSQKKKTL